MRVQIIELPEHPKYLLVLSEAPDFDSETYEHMRQCTSESFDNCAGVILSSEAVQVGPESAHEVQQRLGVAEQAKADELLAAAMEPMVRNEREALDRLARVGIIPSRVVDCPERAKNRGCACLLGAEDCPTDDGSIVIPVEGKTGDEILADAKAAAEQLVDRQAEEIA